MAVSAVRTLFGRFFDTAFGYAVGGSASAAIDPIVTPLAQEAWIAAVTAGVSRALQVADLAQMVVQGVSDENDAAYEASKSGISDVQFHDLVRLAGEPPGPQQLLDLWDRGAIEEGDVDRGLLQSRLKPEWVDDYKKLHRTLLSAPELAEMVVQSVLDPGDATRRAGQVSIEPDDFSLMVRLAGNPPGPMETLEAWNRGIFDEDDATLALRQSRLKPEWIEKFKQLRTRPASTAAAVNAVIKERISPARGIEIAHQNGTDRETFLMLVDEGGRPISITQGLQLLRRNLITPERFREIVARSDVKTEFTDDLLGLKENLPSLAQMRAIIGTGSLADADARATLNKLGYAAAIVEGIIAAGHGVKLEGVKQLTQSAILNAYQAQQLDPVAARELLAGLGYDAQDAGVLLGYADYQRDHAYRSAVIAVVKARFLAHDIDAETASTTLDSVGMPAAERDQYLALWQFDVDANPRLLTLADLNALVKRGIFDPGQYRAYLPRLGFQEPEVSLLVELHAGG